MAVTLSPRDFKSLPMDEAVMPLPSPDITPPVTMMYFMYIPRGIENTLQFYNPLEFIRNSQCKIVADD